MNTFTCIIVDDDHFCIEQLREYITDTPSLKLVNTFNDPIEALSEMRKIQTPIDFLFTDVEMPKMNGIELSKRLLDKFKHLILVSSHLKYAPEGYAVSARQFLTKPFDFRKFSKTVNMMLESFISEKPFIMVKLGSKNETIKIHTDDIIGVEGASNYIKIHTTGKTYMPYYKISAIDEDLKEHPYFLRINKSNIISAKHIKNVLGYRLTLDNGQELSVSSAYKIKFDWFLKNIVSKKPNDR